MAGLAEMENQLVGSVEKLKPSVVSIRGIKKVNDRIPLFHPRSAVGEGSGIVLTCDGYVVTNYHVAGGSESIKVMFDDKRMLTAAVVGDDPSGDLVLLKVEARDLNAASFADSKKLKQGQVVFALGNALGLPGGPSVSMGIISAIGRMLPEISMNGEGFIQTDAALNPGNSGGAVANINGEVVGMATMMIASAFGVSGIGFAIPSNTIISTSDQMIKKGHIERPWLGIMTTTLKEAEEHMGIKLPQARGAVILDVVRGSPAEDAGLTRFDVVTKFGPYEVSSPADFLEAVDKLKPYTDIEMRIIRGNKETGIIVVMRDRKEYVDANLRNEFEHRH